MDSLTQAALGAAVGQTLMGKRIGRLAPIWGAALGTLPDLDVLISFGGVVEDFTYHRSFTHSLVVQLLAMPLVVWLALKIHPATREHRNRWAVMVLAIFWTHALLDAFTVYGTQLLWPITEYPFGISSVFIIDPAYTLLLLLGLFLAGRAGWDSVKANKAMSLMLGFSSVYLGWSVIAKVWVEQSLADALNHKNMTADAILTTPTPFNTLLWRAITVDANTYHVAYLSPWDDPDAIEFRAYDKGENLLDGLEENWNVRRLAWFSKGFYRVAMRGDQVVMTDLRMGIEGSYVFNFAVAETLENKETVPITAEQLQDKMDIRRLPLVFRRIVDDAISLHPAEITDKAPSLSD